MNYFLGIDSSTTATKALLMDELGQVLGTSSSTYTYETPQPLWSEQDPALWWQATQSSIREVIAAHGIQPEDVAGIGLTGQMHGLVILDADKKVLRPSILWNDQRTQAQCDRIREVVGKETFIAITGNDALTGFTAPKILWVAENEPEIYQKIAHILLPKDYVRFCLTGELAMDRAGGSGTVLFDLKQRDWSHEVVSKLGIDEAWLPPTYEGTQATGGLSAQAAELLGLKAGTPVYAGGGDQAASAVGTGAVVEGVISVSVGTSGVVFAAVDHPAVEPEGRLHAFCHAVPDKWHLMGVMLSAAGSLQWFRDTLSPGTEFDELVGAAAPIPAGSEGLYFLPYLSGERTPHPDPLARGAFVGLTVRHKFAHLTRAVLEGVSYGLKDSLELMRSTGIKSIDQVRVTGGGAKSPLWRQILANVFGAQVITVNTTEGAAFGAALLAATGAGAFSSVEAACETVIKVTGTQDPGPDSAVYQERYAQYGALYPALKQNFHQN